MKPRHLLYILFIIPLLASLSSCIDEDEFPDDPNGNFEALWRIIDEHYCFLDYKKQAYGLNWDSIHVAYAKHIDPTMSEGQLFEVLASMLSQLRDGHVNIYSTTDVARYWAWHENYPANFSDTLCRKYLGTDYRISGTLCYRVLDDNIGYIRLSSFENRIGEGNLDHALMYLSPCNGLIIDVRDNSGGLVTAAEEFAARFTNETIVVGYMQHKTGTGHNDFSEMQEQKLKPSTGLRWQKPVVVLTNRGVFSAANEFVKYMECCPNVKTVGDRTGGGAGLPFSSELPNGWAVRFSACPIYNNKKELTEFGITPDYSVALTDFDFLNGKDTIIEYARKLLNKK
jgi:hypothetical protein